jgi:hypothetical protein
VGRRLSYSALHKNFFGKIWQNRLLNWNSQFDQGNQMSLWNSCTKCSPAHFFLENDAQLLPWKRYTVKKIGLLIWFFFNFRQYNQSPNRRKLAQYGHPVFDTAVFANKSRSILTWMKTIKVFGDDITSQISKHKRNFYPTFSLQWLEFPEKLISNELSTVYHVLVFFPTGISVP